MEQNQNYKDIKNVVACHEDVTCRKNGFFKSLLGNKTTMVYNPSNAKLKHISKTYAASDYEAASTLVTKGDASACKSLSEDFNGNVRIECYASSDNTFCAVQLWRFIDFAYAPVSHTYFYTDHQAPALIDTLIR